MHRLLVCWYRLRSLHSSDGSSTSNRVQFVLWDNILLLNVSLCDWLSLSLWIEGVLLSNNGYIAQSWLLWQVLLLYLLLILNMVLELLIKTWRSWLSLSSSYGHGMLQVHISYDWDLLRYYNFRCFLTSLFAGSHGTRRSNFTLHWWNLASGTIFRLWLLLSYKTGRIRSRLNILYLDGLISLILVLRGHALNIHWTITVHILSDSWRFRR